MAARVFPDSSPPAPDPSRKAFDGVEIEVAGEDGIFTARCSKRNLHDSLPLWDFVLLKSAELMQ
jgi:hypothetical protein